MTADRFAALREVALRPHLVVDGDCWFSCPKAKSEWSDGSACCNDDEVALGRCTCGADVANAKIEAAILALAAPVSDAALRDAVSDSLAATTEGTDWAEAPEPSDEPGSPYVLRLANELASRGVTVAAPATLGVSLEQRWKLVQGAAAKPVWMADEEKK